MRAVLGLGVDPGRIIFANPCKSPGSLIFARKNGIFCTTFDNIDELDSIKKHMPEAQLIIRIYANDDSALISFGEKFGAPLDTTASLLNRAWELGLEVIGVSFHVGKTHIQRMYPSSLTSYARDRSKKPKCFLQSYW
jgi:ornithine decarboxylase